MRAVEYIDENPELGGTSKSFEAFEKDFSFEADRPMVWSRSKVMAEAPKDAAASPPKKLNLMSLMLIGFAVINLGAMGTGAFLVYKSTLGWTPPAVLEADFAKSAHSNAGSGLHAMEIQQPLIYTFDKVTVNLAERPPRMIRLEINVEMLSPDGFEEVINPDTQAKLRHRIIELLTSRAYDEVESLQGKLFLKDEIAQSINQTLDRGVVKDVFFSEFVVQ
ncbi:MAG: flagellar basal body-associated FliL family protein [Bdellovibrio sp.]